jgi:hypothetical protein
VIAYLADQSEEYSAQCDGGALTTETIRRSPQVRALDRLRDCATLQELGGELGGDVRTAMTWGWIDFYVSGLFKLSASGSDDVVRCVWMLEQFEPWVFSDMPM